MHVSARTREVPVVCQLKLVFADVLVAVVLVAFGEKMQRLGTLDVNAVQSEGCQKKQSKKKYDIVNSLSRANLIS